MAKLSKYQHTLLSYFAAALFLWLCLWQCLREVQLRGAIQVLEEAVVSRPIRVEDSP